MTLGKDPESSIPPMHQERRKVKDAILLMQKCRIEQIELLLLTNDVRRQHDIVFYTVLISKFPLQEKVKPDGVVKRLFKTFKSEVSADNTAGLCVILKSLITLKVTREASSLISSNQTAAFIFGILAGPSLGLIED